MQTTKSYFTKKQQVDIKQAILKAELDTSGIIRVHIENVCEGDVTERAEALFRKFKLDKTELRNSVLFYMALHNRKFAIIGDSGINKYVPKSFKKDINKKMLTHLKEDNVTEGLCEGIKLTGEILKKHFPHRTDDINELADELSFGK
jgi:uncharacterized membrane protein